MKDFNSGRKLFVVGFATYRGEGFLAWGDEGKTSGEWVGGDWVK